MLLLALLFNSIFLLAFVRACTVSQPGVITTAASGSETAATKAIPSPADSTCGHSKYYYNNGATPGSGVVGGVNAQPNQYPWMVRLMIHSGTSTYMCGASIIDEWYLLTAAHCMMTTTPSNIIAVIADHDSNSVDAGQFSVAISHINIHPNYNSAQQDYDFTLLQLSKPLNFTSSWQVQKICLPTSCSGSCQAGGTAYIAGWGLTSEGGTTPRYLQTATVEIGSQTVCNEQYGDITNQMICAGFLSGGVDTCQGDSGGPLMSAEHGYYELCGVTSFGSGCAKPNYYGVYERVCTVFTWINSFISSPVSTVTSNGTTTTLPTPPNQNMTPSPPPPVSSTCGHSRYYYNSSQPGVAGIVGGVDALPNQYPWLVRMLIKSSRRCNAAIISESYLLTSASCASSAANSTSAIIIYVADHDTQSLDSGEFTLTPSEIIIHPSYDSTISDYDFALLRLSAPLNFTSSWTVQRICLPSSCSDGCSTGSVAYIAGWGTTSYPTGSLSHYLKSAYVRISDRSVCAQQYSFLTDRMMCAGYLGGGVDTCIGDAGGPLMTVESGYYKLCGLTSFGNGCALPNNYGGYSRVCSVVDWIRSKTSLIL